MKLFKIYLLLLITLINNTYSAEIKEENNTYSSHIDGADYFLEKINSTNLKHWNLYFDNSIKIAEFAYPNDVWNDEKRKTFVFATKGPAQAAKDVMNELVKSSFAEVWIAYAKINNDIVISSLVLIDSKDCPLVVLEGIYRNPDFYLVIDLGPTKTSKTEFENAKKIIDKKNMSYLLYTFSAAALAKAYVNNKFLYFYIKPATVSAKASFIKNLSKEDYAVKGIDFPIEIEKIYITIKYPLYSNDKDEKKTFEYHIKSALFDLIGSYLGAKNALAIDYKNLIKKYKEAK